jgi:hypothetical protein
MEVNDELYTLPFLTPVKENLILDRRLDVF